MTRSFIGLITISGLAIVLGACAPATTPVSPTPGTTISPTTDPTISPSPSPTTSP
ncbi:MAG: hypothetical protein RBJ76_18115 [Stenomitos frigidus ULC029]